MLLYKEKSREEQWHGHRLPIASARCGSALKEGRAQGVFLGMLKDRSI